LDWGNGDGALTSLQKEVKLGKRRADFAMGLPKGRRAWRIRDGGGQIEKFIFWFWKPGEARNDFLIVKTR